MSDPISRLPLRASLEQLRKQAKDLLRLVRKGDSSATARMRDHKPLLDAPKLADAQFVIAREYGFESWTRLIRRLESLRSSNRLEQYEAIATEFVAAYSGDADALQRLNELFQDSLTSDQLRELIKKRLGATGDSTIAAFTQADARRLIARQNGFESWETFEQSLAQAPHNPRLASHGISAAPPFYRIDWAANSIEPRLVISESDWDAIFDVMDELQIAGLNANGQMTDLALERLSRHPHVTRLNLGGSKRLTDAGLSHLAGMPQLQELDLSGWHSPITDRGLEVLRSLTELKKFQMCWPQRITDAGAMNLRFCEKIESVDLLGTPTGDGVIEALADKPALHRLKTGRLVTDSGLGLLHNIPAFAKWRGGEIRYSLMSPGSDPTHLLLDGSFTDEGLKQLAGLEGLFGLSFFWHVSAMRPDGLKHLAGLPRLGFLGCEGTLCNDAAMAHIAEIPALRMLMAQGTIADDAGFAALSRSRTLEYLWGRECPNLKNRGFNALASMPALKGLAVSCKNVDDSALAALPGFPALNALMPMDVTDDGFRHVGKCERLEGLWCMYCRETGDIATNHIRGLSNLKTYYAGFTSITDASLAILGKMNSLEDIEFHECADITNAGLPHLVGLPRLRAITVVGSPRVTRDGMSVFPPTTRVNYW